MTKKSLSIYSIIHCKYMYTQTQYDIILAETLLINYILSHNNVDVHVHTCTCRCHNIMVYLYMYMYMNYILAKVLLINY